MGVKMDKIAAAKVEGMLAAARIYLEAIADPLREAASESRRRPLMHKLGKALSELRDISLEIYEEHPEINPFLEQERWTAELRQKGLLPKASK
jgi:hypothetical protein